MKMNVFKNTMKSSIWGIISKIFMLLCAFVVRTVIVYKLGAEYVGLDGLFTSILTLLNLSELGIGSAIVFSMYRAIVDEDYETINQLLFLYRCAYLIIAGLILASGTIIGFFLKIFIYGNVPNGLNIYILYFMFLFNTVGSYLFSGYRTSIFTAYQRNDIKAKIQIISDFIMYGLQIIVLIIFENYYWYIAAMLISLVPKNIFYWYSSRREFKKLNPTHMPDKKMTKEVFGRVVPLLGHKIGGAFLVSIDSIVISSFLGLTILGKYNNYYYIITAIIGITSIIQQALVAGIGNKIIVFSKEHLFTLYNYCSFIWRWIIGWCAICFACLIQPFIVVWIGADYLLPLSIALILSVYYYLWQFRIIGMTFKDAGGLWKNDWYKPYLGMILNTVLSVSLVYITKNILFVLIPTCFIFIFLYFPVESVVISKHILYCDPKKVLLPNVLHSLIIFGVGAVTFGICSLFSAPSIPTLLMRAIIVALVPNIIFMLIYRKSENFKMMISYVERLIKK